MNWKNLSIGKKLTASFGLVIFLTLLLGLTGILNFYRVQHQTREVTQQYLPLSNISNDIATSAQRAMYAQRGYRYTVGENFRLEGQKYLNELRSNLDAARRLTSKYPEFDHFLTVVNETEAALNEYEGYFNETVVNNNIIIENNSKITELMATIPVTAGRIATNALTRNQMQEFWTGLPLAYGLYYESSLQNKASLLGDASAFYAGWSNIFGQADAGDLAAELRLISDLLLDNERLQTRVVELGALRRTSSNALLENFFVVAEESMAVTTQIGEETVSVINRSYIMVVLMVIIAIILAVLLAVFITRSMTRLLNKGVMFTTEVANGNLDAHIDIDQNDEIGQLAHAIKTMVDKLREIITGVMSSSDEIASGSQLISSESQLMAQGASEQASSVEEVSSSMEEMVSNIQQNSDNSKQTEKITGETSVKIQQSAQTSLEAVELMREISDKISIISEIASQTNILALNAAVEAARAGEHGKGFAVVAAEVRKLAEKSQNAADEIEKLSASGMSISESARKELSEVVPLMEKTKSLVQEITAYSIEQNAGADQINAAIQQLNNVTQQNAASSENMASSSEELSSQAENLRQFISFFRFSKK